MQLSRSILLHRFSSLLLLSQALLPMVGGEGWAPADTGTSGRSTGQIGSFENVSSQTTSGF
jgi:hypothetical protein